MKSEIGNKALLRAYAKALDMVDVKGFTSRLEVDGIKITLPINIAGYDLIQGDAGAKNIAGTPTNSQIIVTPDTSISDPSPPIFNSEFELRILALKTVITLGANSALNDMLAIVWRLVHPDGGFRMEIAGNYHRHGNGTIINETVFNLFPGGSTGTLGIDNGGNIGRLNTSWIPANAELDCSVLYLDATGTGKNFPANSTMESVILCARTPKGIVPPL